MKLHARALAYSFMLTLFAAQASTPIIEIKTQEAPAQEPLAELLLRQQSWVDWHPDPEQPLVAIGTHKGDIQIYKNSKNGKTLIQTLSGHKGEVYALAWSETGDMIASCAKDKTIKIWDIKTGLCIKTFQTLLQAISKVSWIQTDVILVTQSGGEIVQYINITDSTNSYFAVKRVMDAEILKKS